MADKKMIDVMRTWINERKATEEINEHAKAIAQEIMETVSNSKIICIFGNGGSAADSQHWAAEMVCTYRSKERDAIPAIALTTDTSIITAWSNDFDYSDIFSRQIKAFRKQIGLAIGLSTSGQSRNVLNGLGLAQKYGMRTILISGNGTNKNGQVKMHVQLPSMDTPVIQSMTQMLYHGVCEYLE